MAITAQTPYTNHMGNGTTTIFAYTFTIFDESDMAVYVDGILQTLTTDYSISNVGSGSGGNVTFVSAPPSGKVVRFVREMPYDREVDYQTSGDLLADTLDNDLDRLECQIQQLGYAIDRAMSYPNSDASSVTGVLPSAVDRAEKVLYFDSTGKPTAVSISVFNNIIAGANYVVDAFTGDGVTKNFVLSIAPGTRSNTDVHIDGVYQNKEGYALTDTVLTFSEAPYSGADIEVVSGDAIPEGFAGNATAVRYVPSGTGAVETNVAAKLSETVSVKDFGAVGDGVTDDTVAIQNAIDEVGDATLFFPAGIYLVGDLSIVGRQITMIGEGMKSTELKAKPGSACIFNAEESSDVQASQFQINNFTLNGNNVAGVIGVNIKFRHKWEIANCIISNCEYGVYELNSWLGSKTNCYFINNTYGAYLAGANHAGVHNSCTFTGADYGVWITTQLTGDVSNIDLTFNSCDFEYNNTSAYGVYVDTPNTVYFNQCYFEETGTAQVCIFMNRGNAIVEGGWINPTAGVNGVFANLSVDTTVAVNNADVLVNDTTKLFYSTGGTITYNNCFANPIPTVLPPQFNLASVGFNNTIQNLVLPTGKQWTSNTVNGATITTTTSETSKTITCTNVGSSGAISLYSALDQSYRPSNNMYLCVTYSTNSSNFKFFVSDSLFGGTQDVYTLPNTSGNVQTALILNENFGASNALLYAEIVNAALTVNDTFTLYNCKLADYRYRTDTLLNISL